MRTLLPHLSVSVRRIIVVLLLALVTLNLLSSQSSADLIAGGHWDFELAYVGGSWDPHWHNHDDDEEKDLDDTVVRGVFDSSAMGVDSPSIRPAGPPWDFTGTSAGSTVYVFPAFDAQPELPFLGIGTEEIGSGVFVGNTIALEFLGIVDGPLGGAFSMWGSTGFSTIPHFSSSNPSLTVNGNQYNANVGGHNHFNLGFTQVGQYELSFNLSGTLVGGGVTQSGPFSVRFEVLTAVPEPSSLMMLGVSSFGAFFIRRRRTVA
jgi:surface-anchored protein